MFVYACDGGRDSLGNVIGEKMGVLDIVCNMGFYICVNWSDERGVFAFGLMTIIEVHKFDICFE